MATLVKLHRESGEEFLFNLDLAIEIRAAAKGGALIAYEKGVESRNARVTETVEEVFAMWRRASGADI